MQSEIVSENLYEIPTCTICLQQLSQDLSSLACGHVFHISCITQHFEYRGSCPNCQKRAMVKEIRLVLYPVVKNNNASAHLRKLLSNFENSEAVQIKCLLSQIKSLSQKNEKSKNDINQFEKQIKKNNNQLEEIRRDLEGKYAEVAVLKKQNYSLKNQCANFKLQNQKLQGQNLEYRVNHDILKQKVKELEHYRVLQKAAQSSSQDMIKYKTQLQSKNTPPEVIAKQFYEMLQLKNLSLLKAKQKQKQFHEKYRNKQQDNVRLRDQTKKLKIQKQQLQNDKLRLKRKFDELRIKYKEIYDKYRNCNQQNSELHDDDSISHSISLKLLAKPIPQEKANNYTRVQKPKIQQKMSFGNTNLKKKANDIQRNPQKNSIKNIFM